MEFLQPINPIFKATSLSKKVIDLLDGLSENIHNKGKIKMDEKLYYEKKNVTTAAEVKETHDYAVEHNYKYYRAVSESGIYFGWIDGKHFKAADGQEWFENLLYKEQTKLQEMLIEKPLTEYANQPINEIPETVNETPIADEVSAAIDYSVLYKEKCVELEKYKIRFAEIETELSAIKSAFSVIANEIQKATMDNKE